MSKTSKYTFSLGTDLIEKIDKLAKKERRSRSGLVNIILEDAMEKLRKQGMLAIIGLILSSCASYPVLNPNSGQVTRCQNGVATIRFDAVEGKRYAEAEFDWDCECKNVRITDL